MIVHVLGSAAGGGFPQANCNCRNCRAVRAGSPSFQPRSQTCIAVSRTGLSWILLGASPDLRQQIDAAAHLHPRPECGPRSSPIKAVMLTNGEVDSIAGLLSLREGFVFDLLASQHVLDTIAANPVFNVLASDHVRRVPLITCRQHHVAELDIEAFPVRGKIALYDELRGGPAYSDETIGLCISDPASGVSFFHIPSCASIDASLTCRLEGARLVFFDGTLYSDDEMISQGLSDKTGRRMGHISMSGPEGAMAALGNLGIQRRVFIHINNSNPVLAEGSDERIAVEHVGWEVAFDGMEIRL
jgi:pyrroloquinoline quinone biosynthesis protein B